MLNTNKVLYEYQEVSKTLTAFRTTEGLTDFRTTEENQLLETHWGLV